MKEKIERNESVRRWRKRGLTFREVGLKFNGLSRQRIHQICSKEQPCMWRLLWGIIKKLIK